MSNHRQRFATRAVAGIIATLCISLVLFGTSAAAWAAPTLTAGCASDSTHFNWSISLHQESNQRVEMSWGTGTFVAFQTVDFQTAGSHSFATARGGTTLVVRYASDHNVGARATANTQLCGGTTGGTTTGGTTTGGTTTGGTTTGGTTTGGTTTGGSTTGGNAECSTDAAVTWHSDIMNADEAGTASVSFKVKIGCNVELTLVSYTAPGPTFDRATANQQTVFDFKTMTFVGGNATYTLSVAMPDCFWQVDFVRGKKIDHFGTEGFYSDQGRLIAGENGGEHSCANGTTGTTTGGTTGSTTGSTNGTTGTTTGGTTGETSGGTTGSTTGGTTGSTTGGTTGSTTGGTTGSTTGGTTGTTSGGTTGTSGSTTGTTGTTTGGTTGTTGATTGGTAGETSGGTTGTSGSTTGSTGTTGTTGTTTGGTTGASSGGTTGTSGSTTGATTGATGTTGTTGGQGNVTGGNTQQPGSGVSGATTGTAAVGQGNVTTSGQVAGTGVSLGVQYLPSTSTLGDSAPLAIFGGFLVAFGALLLRRQKDQAR